MKLGTFRLPTTEDSAFVIDVFIIIIFLLYGMESTSVSSIKCSLCTFQKNYRITHYGTDLIDIKMLA